VGDRAEVDGATAGGDVLVVGGTGMLRPAVHALADTGRRVVVVARRPDRALRGASSASVSVDAVVPVVADWAEPYHLADQVAAAFDGEPIDAALLWIHSPHHRQVLAELDPLLAPSATVVQLWGSARRDPSAQATAPPPGYGPPRAYRRVVLGYVRDGAGSRWLTDEEISQGALRALDDPAPVQIVGRTEPWSQRP
jgi:NAD(P)-dependent dehydrogenase (short-subunit alcohol dehydrogenase family)